jgi:hypothetical protein
MKREIYKNLRMMMKRKKTKRADMKDRSDDMNEKQKQKLRS